jgi:NhaA family Na+:H+ antiporter
MKIEHWVNDVLMSIFFLLIGLELKREFKEGELSSWKNASLPIFSALGGMIVPALIFIGFNFYQGTITGFGIPMATDIAFALGILSLLGNRVPLSLKIFLTALAVIDDLGAVLVIAIFYTSTIVWLYLGLAVAIFGLMLVLNKLKVVSLLLYLPLGILMWYFMHHSGVHSTIAGVLFAFALPSEDVEDRTDPSELLQKALHIPVPYIILPVFALANTAIPFTSGLDNSFVETVGAGVFAGLVLGKPLGIFLFAFAAVKLKLSSLPNKVNWTKLIGVGILGGIGFTMSIFVTMLAFEDEQMINKTKIIGLIWLRLTLKKKTA